MRFKIRRSTIVVGAAAALLCAAAPAWAQGGNGLTAQYFGNDQSWTTRTGVRIDATIDHVNGTGTAWSQAFVAGMGLTDTTNEPPSNFSVIWQGQLLTTVAGVYTLALNSDDGSFLYLDGQLVIDNGGFHGDQRVAYTTPALQAATKYNITVTFFQGGGGATTQLLWTPPGGAEVPIPQSQLFALPALPATPAIAPNGGSPIPMAGVTLTSADAPPGIIWYTLDGTDPGLANPSASAIQYAGPFTVNSYGRLRARVYNAGVSSDLLTSNVFSPQFPALTPPGGLVPKLYFKEVAFAGGGALPTFPGMIPRRRGLVDQPTGAVPPSGANNFAYNYQGYISIATTGIWTFYLSSADASRLIIDGLVVIDNTLVQNTAEQTGDVGLDAGLHSIIVQYAHGTGATQSLDLKWQGPAANPPKQTIPAGSYFTEDIAATPTFGPAPGNFVASQVVTITSTTANATIFYTLNGTDPDPLNAAGSGLSPLQVTLTGTTTLKAMATAPGFNAGNTSAGAIYTRTDSPLVVNSAVSAQANTEVIVHFARPVLESTIVPGNFTLDNGATVSGAAALTRPGALAGWWKLDDLTTGATSDSSGNNNNGTVTAATQDAATLPFANFINPASANASSFNFAAASNATVSVPNNATLNMDVAGFTVSAWVNTSDAGIPQRVVNKYDTTGTAHGWVLDICSNTSGAFAANTVRFRVVDTAGTITDVSTVRPGNIVAGTWYHLVGRVDKTTNRLSIFVNGTQIGTITDMSATHGSVNTTVPLLIGSLSGATPNYFVGNIDDVRLYKAVLTDAEIAALAATSDHVSSSVKLTTSTLTSPTAYTLTVGTGVTDVSGNAVASGSTMPFRFFPTGTITYERWGNYDEGTATGTVVITGGNITDLTRNALFPNSPTMGLVPNKLEVPQTAAPNVGNYGARIRGYLIPPATNNYQFAQAVDDGGKFFLSTDEDPANKVLISYENQWAPLSGYADPDIVQSGSIPLVAGKKYYFEGYMKEGGGGDHITVAVQVFSATTPIPNNHPSIGTATSLFPNSAIAPYVDPPVVVTQPVVQALQAGQTINLSVTVRGTDTGVTRIQWQKDGVNLAGQTAATLTIANVTPANAGNYTAVITNSSATVTSAIALVTVLNDPYLTITPSGGPLTPGTPVTITGSGFVPNSTTVTFGGVAATSVVVANDTSLTLLAPAHAVGPVVVVVSTPGGSSTGSYTYYNPPTIGTPLNPAAGSSAQTTPNVSIPGTNFAVGQTSVTFGGTPATNVVVAQTGLSLTCTAPIHVVGQVNVVVTTPGGVATGTNAFTYYDPPTLNATPISPIAGPLGGLPGVGISGTNFVPGLTSVTFGGTPATAINVALDGFSLTCTAPPHAAGTVDVVVTTPGGPITATNGFTYYPIPTLTGAPPVQPAAGPLGGLVGVAITGTAFAPNLTSVTFGGTPATNVVVAGNGLSLVCDAPLHAAGLVNVVVTTPGGFVTGPNLFTYTPAPTLAVNPCNPNAGPSSTGLANVTVTGTNFIVGQTSVSFGGTPATGIVVAGNGQSLICNAPAHAAGPVDVTVTTPGGTTAPAVNAFTYYDAPTLNAGAVSPNTGPSQGGTAVTISGTNFVPGATTVTFGGAAAVVGTVLTTSISATTPGHDFGSVTVVVTTPGGVASQTTAYLYFGPRITSVSPGTGPASGATSVTISGSGFTGATAVSFGANPATTFSVSNDSTIIATAPAGTGTVAVTVTAPSGTASLPAGYVYLTNPTLSTVTLNRGPLGGGQTVSLSGSNFGTGPGQTTVTFGGAPATGINVTDTNTLICTTPAGAAGSVTVSVTTFGTQTVNLPNGYTYVSPPTVTGITPTRGPTTGVQSVTITGTNFEQNNQTAVTIGGAPATAVVVANSTTLTCNTPAGAAGVATVTVSTFTPPQSGSLPGIYTYVNPATSVDLSVGMIVDNSAPLLGTNVTFTITLNNTGAVAATNISVQDALPTGMTFVSATPSAGTYTAATGLWNISAMAASGSATLAITATITSGAALVNQVEVVGVTEQDVDSTPGNGIVGEDDIFILPLSAGLVVTTPGGVLAPATSGAFYYRRIAASGGVPPYTWSLGSLPATFPFALDPATGTISCVAPVATGTFSFTLTASDSSSTPLTASQNFSITVSAPVPATLPTITALPAPPGGTAAVPYYHQFTATGGPVPYTWSVSGGSLPGGLFLNSLTGVVAGTPSTVGGPVNFTIQATNSVGSSSQAFSITIASNPMTIVGTLANGSVGAPYDQTLTLVGGIGPFNWSQTGLPGTGTLTLTGSGRVATIVGTPASNTPLSVNITVQDASVGGGSTSKIFPVTILTGAAAFKATSSANAGAVLNRPMLNINLTGLGGVRPYTWSLVGGSLPAGVTLNGPSGIISGTPTASGVFAATIRGTDSGATRQTDDHTITINVAPAPVITTPATLPNGISNVAYFAPLSVSGGMAPYSWAVTGASPLPPNLALPALSGAIAGFPTGASVTSLDVTVTDAFPPPPPAKTFSLTILDSAGALAIVSGLPPATIGVPYSATVTATGGSGSYTFLPVGTPPSWGTFDALTGTLYGVPDGSPITFQVQVNGTATTSSMPATASPMAIVQTSLPGGSTNVPYGASLTTTGAAAPVVWTLVSGSVPSGLTLQTDGNLVGTPALTGTSTFKVQVTDAVGKTAQRQFSVAVGAGTAPGGGGGGGGGGGCGLTGFELLGLYLLRRVIRRKER